MSECESRAMGSQICVCFQKVCLTEKWNLWRKQPRALFGRTGKSGTVVSERILQNFRWVDCYLTLYFFIFLISHSQTWLPDSVPIQVTLLLGVFRFLWWQFLVTTTSFQWEGWIIVTDTKCSSNVAVAFNWMPQHSHLYFFSCHFWKCHKNLFCWQIFCTWNVMNKKRFQYTICRD